eukprot:symbB.v1.2.016167.t1/scaffold1226.1/size132380/3
MVRKCLCQLHRRGRDDQEIPLPTSPVTSPGEEDDRYAVPVSAQPGSYHSESDGPTESPSVELPVPSEVRPTSEAPSYEEIEILLDEAAMRAEVGTEEIIPLSSSLPHSSAPPRDSSTEPTSPNMVPTQVPSPTEIGGDDPTVPFPTLTRQPATVEPRRAAPEVPVPQVSSSGQMSSGLISSAFVSSPTEMPMPTELLSPTSIGDEDFEDETSVPTVVRTAEPAVMQAPVVTPLQGERPSSPTEVMEDQMTVEAPTMLHPLPEVQMSGSGSLITTGLQSSSVPPASPTEMPVPTDMPSPTEEGDLDYREEATVQPVLQVQSSAIITSTSQVHSSSGHPGSPTELPVPTDLPSPTEEGDVDYVDEATLPPPREPTEAVTSTMPSSLSRPPSSTVSRRRQPGVAPSSPGDVPVPTARPSPTSPGHLEEEAIMGPLPAFSSALLPGSSVPSPSDMPVPTYVPSPTEDIHLDLPTESVPVDQVREPTDSIPSEPTRTMPTRTLPTAPTARPTIPTVAQRRRGAPSSPADLPVPTQMPSPSAAFRDEEEDLRPLPPSGAYSSGKLMSSGFSSRAPVTPSEMPVPTFVPSPTMAPEEYDATETVAAPTRAATSPVATATAPPVGTVTARSRKGQPPSPVEMPVPTFVPSPTSPQEELLETVAPPTAAVTSPGAQVRGRQVPSSPLPVPTEAVPSPTYRQEADTVPPSVHPVDVESSAMRSSAITSSGVVQSPSEMPVPTYVPSPTSPRDADVGTTAPTAVATQLAPTASEPTMLEYAQEAQSALASSFVISDSGHAMSSPTELPVPTEMQSPTSAQAMEGDEPTVVPFTMTALTVPAPEAPAASTYFSDSVPMHSPELAVPTEMPTPTEHIEELKAPEPPEAPVLDQPQISSSHVVSTNVDSMPMSSPTELPVPTEMPSPTEGLEETVEVETKDATAAFTREMEVETRMAPVETQELPLESLVIGFH